MNLSSGLEPSEDAGGDDIEVQSDLEALDMIREQDKKKHEKHIELIRQLKAVRSENEELRRILKLHDTKSEQKPVEFSAKAELNLGGVTSYEEFSNDASVLLVDTEPSQSYEKKLSHGPSEDDKNKNSNTDKDKYMQKHLSNSDQIAKDAESDASDASGDYPPNVVYSSDIDQEKAETFSGKKKIVEKEWPTAWTFRRELHHRNAMGANENEEKIYQIGGIHSQKIRLFDSLEYLEEFEMYSKAKCEEANEILSHLRGNRRSKSFSNKLERIRAVVHRYRDLHRMRKQAAQEEIQLGRVRSECAREKSELELFHFIATNLNEFLKPGEYLNEETIRKLVERASAYLRAAENKL